MKKIYLNNKFLIFVSVLLFCFCANAELFKVHEFALNNGLQVVVVENHKAPIIKQMLWYNVGAIDDGLGKGGRAHFLEHLMFRGTDKLKDGEFNNLMEKNGVSHNAFTSYEFTAYHEFSDISKLELLMAVEADRMKGLNFDEAAFETEKKVVIQERKQVVENNPAAPFYERLRHMIWGNQPFGRPVTGLIEEIEALSYQDVRDFYERYYAPNNAILVLAGDIDADTAKILAEKYFGAIKAVKIKRNPMPVLKEKFSQNLEMALPNIQTAKIVEEYILPTYAELGGNHQNYDALAEYLGGGQTSALYRNLVLERRIAVSVSASFDPISRTNTSFSLSLIPADGVSASKAEQALHESLEKAISELDEQKVASLKKKLVADLVYINDNPSDSAYLVGTLIVSGLSLEYLKNYEADVKKISLKGVKDAYREVFFNSAKATGILLPQSEDEK